MKTKISNIDELKWEIARLTELKREQEAYLNSQYTLLKKKVDTPVRVLSTLSSSIPGVGLMKGIFSAASKNNNIGSGNSWVRNIVRVGLPLVLNRTFLKNSTWLKKSLVMLLSDTAAKQVTEENVTGVISKLASFIRPKEGKEKRRKKERLNKNLVEDSLDDQILGI